MSDPSRPRGRYFEEFATGDQFTTMGRTVTETDIVQFAGLSGDYNQIHTDAVFAGATPFGQRIAHGTLSLAIITGLLMQSGVVEGTILAFREIVGWTFSKPVHIGDTIHGAVVVAETKALPRLHAGSVIIRIQVQNQDGATVQHGTLHLLVQARP
jgi:acyl dehydratase